jgi:thiamine kinase-like enzyme
MRWLDTIWTEGSMKALGSPQDLVEQRAEKVLASVPGGDRSRLTYGRALPSVASPSFHASESATFIVDPDGEGPSLFLRLGLDEVADLVDPGVAQRAAHRCHSLGISPQLVYGDPDERAMVFEALDGSWRTARVDDLMKPEMAARLVGMHKRIASASAFGRTWSIFDGIGQMWKILGHTSDVLPGDADWMLAWISSIHEAISAVGADLLPAHADPHSSNVMIGTDGRLMLVDFDMAADVDPYYVLGALMNELFQFESQMKPLLEMHDGRFNERAFNRCRLYAAADDFYWALRSLVLEVRLPRCGVEYLKYAAWRFLRCRMLLGRPNFEELVRSI